MNTNAISQVSGQQGPREPQLSTDSVPKTAASLGTHILRFSPNFSSIFSSHRRSIMEHVNSVFPFLYNVSQPPFKYNSLSGFAPKHLSNFLFPFQYFLPPRHQQMGRNDAVPPLLLCLLPPPLSSHTPVLSSASLPASWHRPVVPEMLRGDQEKKSVTQVSLSKFIFSPLKKNSLGAGEMAHWVMCLLCKP